MTKLGITFLTIGIGLLALALCCWLAIIPMLNDGMPILKISDELRGTAIFATVGGAVFTTLGTVLRKKSGLSKPGEQSRLSR